MAKPIVTLIALALLTGCALTPEQQERFYNASLVLDAIGARARADEAALPPPPTTPVPMNLLPQQTRCVTQAFGSTLQTRCVTQ